MLQRNTSRLLLEQATPLLCVKQLLKCIMAAGNTLEVLTMSGESFKRNYSAMCLCSLTEDMDSANSFALTPQHTSTSPILTLENYLSYPFETNHNVYLNVILEH